MSASWQLFLFLQLRNLRPALFGEDAIVQFFLFEGGEEGICVEIPGHSRNSMLELDKRDCLFITRDV